MQIYVVHASESFDTALHYLPPQANRFNIPKARALYEQALQADPRHLQTLLALGSLEGRAGNVEKGKGHLIQGLQQRPLDKHFTHALAQLYRNHGNKEVGPEHPLTVGSSGWLAICKWQRVTLAVTDSHQHLY